MSGKNSRNVLDFNDGEYTFAVIQTAWMTWQYCHSQIHEMHSEIATLKEQLAESEKRSSEYYDNLQGHVNASVTFTKKITDLERQIRELRDAARLIIDTADECADEDGNTVFTVNSDFLHRLEELLDKALQGQEG
jgi:chromosome segregation ATPase